MVVGGASDGIQSIFKVRPGHEPKSDAEFYARLHYYVYYSVIKVGQLLNEALVEIRKSAGSQPTPELQRIALKPCRDSELHIATKELWCIWVHLDVVEQGGEDIQPWLMRFYKMALGTCDLELPNPKCFDMLNSYENCDDEGLLFTQAAMRTCRALNCGAASEAFAEFIRPIVADSDVLRRAVLEEAMTFPVDMLSLP